jgi:hypothetical protein
MQVKFIFTSARLPQRQMEYLRKDSVVKKEWRVLMGTLCKKDQSLRSNSIPWDRVIRTMLKNFFHSLAAE